MDLYQALGVRREATTAEIRRAWQRKSRALHPALNPGDPVAADRYRQVARAFEVLADPKRRAAYDRGELVSEPAAPVMEAGFEGFDFSARVRVEKVSFREIFDTARSPSGRPGGATRGEDLEQATRVSFEEVLTGTTRRVHLVRHERCPACEGSGEVAFGPVPCPRCGGEGRALASEWLEVKVPAGVRDGSQVRLPGAGNAGRRGGPAGDFLLTVEVEAHPLYRREGDDLHVPVPVGMIVAAMGGHVDVATPDGPVTIEIPAGTQHGQHFRLRKRGAPRLGEKERGDLWAEVRVVIPAATDDRARALLRELQGVLAATTPAVEKAEP
jgi:molecular chaperone DnaJ